MSGTLLEALDEEELGSVFCALDYVQFDSSAARFAANAWPTVCVGHTTLPFGGRGHRDALCALRVHHARGAIGEPREWGTDGSGGRE